jgi:hypothetical protein
MNRLKIFLSNELGIDFEIINQMNDNEIKNLVIEANTILLKKDLIKLNNLLIDLI